MSNNTKESVNGFDHFKLADVLQRGIAAAGFVEPRPIQTQAVPAILEGRDVLGLAQTGTGKTAAFALPILQGLLAGRQPGPRTLILAPTRELAAQISEEIRLLARFTKIQVATIFGGVSVFGQRKALAKKPEIVVACPGRLLDLLGQGIIRLDRIETLVHRRGGPHVRHGLPAGHPQDPERAAERSSEPALLGHHAEGDSRPGRPDPAQSARRRCGTQHAR